MDGLWSGGRLVELDADECLALLGSVQVGRVVFTDARGPVAVPVNHRLQEGTVLLRTSPYNSLAGHLRENPTCAFEVDSVDASTQSGWSVLVRGSAALVRHPSATATDDRPTPWPEGTRSLVIRITPFEITGRRLEHS